MVDKHRLNITISLELIPHQIITSSFELKVTLRAAQALMANQIQYKGTGKLP